MNLTKQEKLAAMGKVRLFCSSLAGAGGRVIVCGCWFSEGCERVWRGGVVGEAGSGVGFMWRELMAAAGIVEIAVGMVCLLGKSRLFRAGSLLFLGSELLLYRGMYWGAGAKEPCPYWGGLLEWVGMDRGEGNWMATSVLVYTLLAGFVDLPTKSLIKSKQRTT